MPIGAAVTRGMRFMADYRRRRTSTEEVANARLKAQEMVSVMMCALVSDMARCVVGDAVHMCPCFQERPPSARNATATLKHSSTHNL